MPDNQVSELKAFFSTSEKPCSTQEFMEFWKSCTESEKAEYRAASLS